jgi:uncharacterized small protein (DUF1192 family)
MSELPSRHPEALLEEIARLKAENTRLKTEVQNLMVFCNCTLIPNKELQAENARLKAEVEELTGLLKASTYYNTSDEVTRLKAEVERLTKAGDAMAEAMWHGDNGRSIWVKKFAETDWNAAKEGKPRA